MCVCVCVDTMDAMLVSGFSNFFYTLFTSMLFITEACCGYIELLSQATNGNAFLTILSSVCLAIFVIESLSEKEKKNK